MLALLEFSKPVSKLTASLSSITLSFRYLAAKISETFCNDLKMGSFQFLHM